jgi:hypothetical protein
MKEKRAAWLAWSLCTIVIVGSLIGWVSAQNVPGARQDALAIANNLLNSAFTSVFGIVGALILGRYPRHTIGWLLMFMALSLTTFGLLQSYLGQTATASTGLNLTVWLYFWLSGWTWWLLIAPLLLILLLFPTGHLLSPRWRWVVVALTIIITVFLIFATFSKTVVDTNSGKTWPNPLGVIPASISFEAIQTPYAIALMTTVVLCVISVLIRYRRAASMEREQLKWFLYACTVFLMVYAVGFWVNTDAPTLFGVALSTAILLIPISIGIAILRYRLFDIDLIIRRTLVYSVLTALLALTYFGGVVLVQQLTRSIAGESSEVAIVVSTLAIAALFFPLRRRVQSAIDRRFYRRKYDAAKTLAAFSATVRDEVELDQLTSELLNVVQETMQPASVSLWLKAEKGGK